MNKQQMIEDIMEEMADKELKFGCKFTGFLEDQELDNKLFEFTYNDDDYYEDGIFLRNGSVRVIPYKILGNTIHIGTVLYYIEKNNLEEKNLKELTERKGEGTQFTYTPLIDLVLHYWKKKDKDLSEQDESCVKFILEDIIPLAKKSFIK